MGSLYAEARGIAHQVWQRRWIALAVAWGVCVLGWLVVSLIPNQYVSTARVFVQLRTILPSQDSSFQQMERAKDIDRVRQTLTSQVNLQKVVRGTDLAQTATTDAQVAARAAGLATKITVVATQENLFEISATTDSPRQSQQIVQKLIDIFVEDNIANQRDESGQSLRFLDQQIEARQRALQEAEAKSAAFYARFLGSLPGTGSLDERVGNARTQLSQIEADLIGAQSSLTAVNAQMAGTPATVPGIAGAPIAGPARARVSTIEGQLAEARGRGWTDSHPDVRALQSQLSQARVAAQGEPSYGGGGGANNPLYLQLRSMQAERSARVSELNQRRAQLQADLGTLQAQINADPAAAAEQARIDRDLQVMKDEYAKLLTSREGARLQSQVQTETDAVKFSVIDPPAQPTAPAAPSRPLLLSGVLFVGLAAGIGAAFALSQLQSTFASAAKLEKAAGIPVIGSIGEIVSDATRGLRRQRLKQFAGAAGALGGAWIILLAVEMVQRGMVA
ncbi:XrtA system polysaccharide chain length determinant [Sphingomonas sp. AX6]|uniref:XrtA system polysaccharide chain length determinant n=1 Tax=Sphingomonas sp. AX6 TaxID=2653171 RepID=UPI0012F1A7A7|nr:XrtA system polysaccharide chain length determinant [Sphingomonas sp. AX6]VXC91999.1 Polysaccharide chain length determinant protein, PEP-CTERM locus subfamily [Sphingomonas sp. AX6]